jgi:glutamyl-tRNA synthetase
LFKERIDFVGELWDKAKYMFVAPESYDIKVIKDKWKPDTAAWLKEFADKLERIETFSLEEIDRFITEFMKEKGLGMGQIMPVLRLAVIGHNKGPEMNRLFEILGKEESERRIRRAIEIINN